LQEMRGVTRFVNMDEAPTGKAGAAIRGQSSNPPHAAD